MEQAQTHVASDVVVGSDLASLAELCAGPVRRMSEAGLHYIYMQGLRFLVKGDEKQMDAILCLGYPNPTYPTKLYLPLNLGLGLNWNETAYIVGKSWFTWSWRGVSSAQSPLEILAGHLEAFR